VTPPPGRFLAGPAAPDLGCPCLGGIVLAVNQPAAPDLGVFARRAAACAIIEGWGAAHAANSVGD
jgi:hypothetical protein